MQQMRVGAAGIRMVTEEIGPSAGCRTACGGRQGKRAALRGRPLDGEHEAGSSSRWKAPARAHRASKLQRRGGVAHGCAELRFNILGEGCAHSGARTCGAARPGVMATRLKHRFCNGGQQSCPTKPPPHLSCCARAKPAPTSAPTARSSCSSAFPHKDRYLGCRWWRGCL